MFGRKQPQRLHRSDIVFANGDMRSIVSVCACAFTATSNTLAFALTSAEDVVIYFLDHAAIETMRVYMLPADTDIAPGIYEAEHLPDGLWE